MQNVEPTGILRAAATLCLLGIAAIGGCDLVAGIGTYCTEGIDPGCGTSGAGGGSGGTGAGGSGTGGMCEPGASIACYDGPAGTEGVGLCRAGSATCNDDGTAYGSCSGQVLPATEDCATSDKEDCSEAPDCGACLWNKILENPDSTGPDLPRRIAVDPAGNRILGIQMRGKLNLGCGELDSGSTSNPDVVVAKLDAFGNCIWSKQFGDNANQYLTTLLVDTEGNVLVTGAFDGTINFGQDPLSSLGSDTYIAKLDTNGDQVWSNKFGDDDNTQEVTDLSLDAAGNVIAVGRFMGALSFGGATLPLVNEAPHDALFVAKLDGSGLPLWSHAYGAPEPNSYVRGQAIATDGNGNIYVVGHLHGKLVVPPTPEVSAIAHQGIMLARFSGDGTAAWNKAYESTAGPAYVYDVTTDISGSAILAGTFQGTLSFGGVPLVSADGTSGFLAKVDVLGGHQWSTSLGINAAASDAQPTAVTTDDAKNLFVAGNFHLPGDFGCGLLESAGASDIFITKFDDMGTCTWSKRFGDPNDQFASDLAMTGSNLTLLGLLNGSMDAGCGIVSSGPGAAPLFVTIAP